MSTRAQKAANGSQKLPEALARLHESVLAMVMAYAPLAEILQALCATIEKHYPDLLCSVLVLDPDGVTLHPAAAPSLPSDFSQSIEGLQIGPNAGSCGAAAYRREQVIVADIASDPLWASARQLALANGLRACWSTPIFSHDRKVLGTFAIYYFEPRTPDPEHQELITHATNLAAIAMERDRAKAELIAAESRYRTLVERLPAITYIAELGAHGRWHYVSPQIQSMLGFSPEEWLANSSNWIDGVHPEDRESVLAVEEHFLKKRDLFRAEYRMHARHGGILWFRDEAVMLPSAEDQPNLMQGVMYDITAHKRLEDQLRQSQKMEAVGLLAGGVAHDFNNLLMLIQGHNERLRSSLGTGAAAQRESAGIEQAVTRAASLTGRLLSFSRKQVLQPKVMDLNEALTETGKLLDRLIGKNIALRLAPATGLWTIKADPAQIEQLIMNLAVNARDAMPQGGDLLIETRNVDIEKSQSQTPAERRSGQYAVLVVKDNGVGMDRDTQAHMFEPFFTTKEPGKGTGLGLAIVYGVVKQLGGWIQVESKPGQGAKFEIYLPRAEQPKAEPEDEDSRGDLTKVENGTETILLVEDEIGIRELAYDFLQAHGYKVLTAADGNDALRIAEGHEDLIHLLVTDVVMPNVGGKELAKRLRQVRPEIKVIFMSGHPDHPALADEDLAAHSTILQKPFYLDKLAHKIRGLLDQR